MKKKITSLLLVAIFVLSTFAIAHAASPNQDSLYDSLTLEEMAAIDAGTTLEELEEMGLTLEELLAMDAENDAILGENFSANRRAALHVFDILDEAFISARDGRMIYPDFFGGAAIDHDGNIVIFIVESMLNEAYSHDVIGVLLDDGVRYRVVDFSYGDLLSSTDVISATITERYTNERCIYSYNVSLIGPSALTNRIDIHLVIYDEDMIAGFRRYIYDSPALVFRQGNRISIVNYQGGATFCYIDNDMDWAYTSGDCNYLYFNHYHEKIVPFNALHRVGTLVRRRVITGGPFARATIGFAVDCTRTGTRGFLTTAGDTFSRGHDVLTYTPFNIGGSHIGDVTASRIRDTPNGGINASFATLRGSYSVANILPHGATFSTVVVAPRQGDTAHAFGGASNRQLTGVITHTNAVVNHGSNISLTRMTIVQGGTAMSETGNSGGPVYSIAGNPMGIISGGDSSLFAVTPLYRIFNEFRQSYNLELRIR